jgi:hypothetical protein
MDLKLRWNSDYKQVWCFFDSSIVVNLVQMSMDMFHKYGNLKWNIKNFCLEIEWLICNILWVRVMLPLLFGLRKVLWMTTTSLSSMNSPDMFICPFSGCYEHWACSNEFVRLFGFNWNMFFVFVLFFFFLLFTLL